MNFKKIILLPMIVLLSVVVVYAGDGTRGEPENIDKYRFGMDIGIKLAKGLKLNIEPELRFNDGFDAFLLNGGMSYKTFGCVYWGASYRLVCDREEAATTSTIYSYRTEYDWEYLHRYAFDVTYKDSFKRFTPSFRLRYNNYTDEGESDEGVLRYRAKLEYDIRKCRFTPEISAEAFQSVEEDYMFSKMRYSAGFNYKINKRSALSLDYKLDFFMLEYKNTHIFTFGYKLSL